MKQCRHLFLTGEVQVGKSTILNRLVQFFHKPAGFCTRWESENGRLDRLYLMPYPPCRPYPPEALVASRICRGNATGVTERFEALGPEILKRDGDLIVMDELGMLERHAPAFRASIMTRLDGDIPVLGVIKPRGDAFIQAIHSHPRVRVETVTIENRDALLQQLLREAQEGSLWQS